jgi:hypothetical protein
MIYHLPDGIQLHERIMMACQEHGRSGRTTLGLHPVGACLDDFATHIKTQYDEYGRIIREAGMKTE